MSEAPSDRREAAHLPRLSEAVLRHFEQLCDLDDEAQERGLAELERMDPQLRVAVTRLLKGDRLADPGLEGVAEMPPELLRSFSAGPGPANLVHDDGDVESAKDPDLSGLRVGGCTLLRRLGAGGMGVVWEAEQEQPRRRVAIKFLRSSVFSPQARRRFEHEVELAGRLHHPSIAQVHSAGHCELLGQPASFFVMQLVHGARTLDEYVRTERPERGRRLELFQQICAGVHHAHQRGVIHRDLKPSNILVDEAGTPKIIDFGVARATDPGLTITRDGELVGTLAYMSPEQCTTGPATIDVRSDVYSLGVVLFELVCSHLPHDIQGKSLGSAALMIRESPPRDPKEFDCELPKSLRAIIMKAIARQPDSRYESPCALSSDIGRWLRGEPVVAREAGAWSRAVAWTLRHPLAVTSLAGVSVVLVSALSVLGTIHFLARRPSLVSLDPQQSCARLLTSAGYELARWQLPDGSFSFAGLVERSTEAGGGRFVVLASRGSSSGAEKFTNNVSFYELLDLYVPSWTSEEVPLVAPPEGAPQDSGRYTVNDCLVADVFPEIAGPEVIALHRNTPFDATAIRVYDCRGGLRYQTWHYGALEDMHWLEHEHLLVVGGVNSESRWDELGHPMKGSRLLYPAVVLALEVNADQIETEQYLAFAGRLRPGVRWYKWLGPPEELAPFQDVIAHALPPSGKWRPQDHIEVMFQSAPWSGLEPAPRLALILDPLGAEVDRVVYDSYRRWVSEGVLPEDSTFGLRDYQELGLPRY